MRDPERLLGLNSGADELERELLQSVKDEEPPVGAKDAAWLGIAGAVTAGAAASATLATSSSAAAAGKAASGALWTSTLAGKAAMAVAASALAVGGYVVTQRVFEGEAPKARAPMTAPMPQRAPAAPEELELAVEPSAEPVVPAAREDGPTPTPAGKREPTEASASAALSAESALLMAARAQLRAGDLTAADDTLARLSAQFPRGVLVQEREVLAIELLGARGKQAQAQQRARAFIRDYPRSPHSAKLSRLLERR